MTALRIFLAGATGVIGTRLVPLLATAGHTVAGMSRTPAKLELVRQLGGQPVLCDVHDARALREAVVGFGPDLVLHQLTDLPDRAEDLPAGREANARIRVDGTANLIAAAAAAHCPRLIAQSIAWEQPPGVGADAVQTLEQAVLGFGGVVLRYGQFWGPDTYHQDSAPDGPRVHIDTAAARTVELLDAPRGIITVTDEGDQ